MRLQRNPERTETYIRARANVTARWKEKGFWKDSWSNNLPQSKDWRDLPGWKWRHESASPEPPDPDDMEFTPSEIDAMEAIRPPTPPPPPKLSSLENRPPSPGAHPVRFLFWECFNNPPPASALPSLTPPTDDDGDDEDPRPGAAAELMNGGSAQRSLEDDADMAPRTEQNRPTTRATSHEQRRQLATRHPLTRSNGRTTSSTAQVEISSPATRKSRQGREATGAPISSSKISKPTPPTRRSLRIAKREGRLEGVDAPSEATEAMNEDEVAPQPQLDQYVKGTSTRTTRRRPDRAKQRNAQTSSKAQGVTKPKGRSRRLNA